MCYKNSGQSFTTCLFSGNKKTEWYSIVNSIFFPPSLPSFLPFSFLKTRSSAYCMPGTVLGPRKSMINEIHSLSSSCPHSPQGETHGPNNGLRVRGARIDMQTGLTVHPRCHVLATPSSQSSSGHLFHGPVPSNLGMSLYLLAW